MIVDKEKIDFIRAKKQISVADLKRKGVTQGNLNSIYAKRSLRPETIGKIAEILGVDIEEILKNKSSTV